jgi:hypothetical protein
MRLTLDISLFLMSFPTTMILWSFCSDLFLKSHVTIGFFVTSQHELCHHYRRFFHPNRLHDVYSSTTPSLPSTMMIIDIMPPRVCHCFVYFQQLQRRKSNNWTITLTMVLSALSLDHHYHHLSSTMNWFENAGSNVKRWHLLTSTGSIPSTVIGWKMLSSPSCARSRKKQVSHILFHCRNTQFDQIQSETTHRKTYCKCMQMILMIRGTSFVNTCAFDVMSLPTWESLFFI